MNGETGFCIASCLVGGCLSVCCGSEGSSPWGRNLRAADLYAVGFGLILTMMQSCASAAKLRAAGPFCRSASGARFEYGFPPPRIVNSAVVLEASASAENGGKWHAPFRTLDVRRRPPAVRP
jgi:hypothetical protein